MNTPALEHTPRSDELAIDSVTGVDVSMSIAGAGGRSYAFVIDWHFRVLLVLAWWLVSSFIYFGDFTVFGDFEDDGTFETYFLGVTLPMMLIYFLYHPVLEIAMHGRTPGKRMAGVRIVTRDGATPGVGALLIRNVFRLVDSLPVFYCVGFAVVLCTSQNVRIGDLAAGTLLVYERDRKLQSSANAFAVANAAIDPRLAELADDVLTRWKELSPSARMALGRSILARAEPAAAAGMSTDGRYVAERQDAGGDAESEAQMLERLRELLSAQRS
jgi:uncharacterized RDD family membrane protein YckC